MSEKLRAGLASLAEQAESVDLHARVVRLARRRTLYRRVTAALAVLALGTGGMVAVAALRPDRTPPDILPSPTVSVEPSPVPSPTPSPTPTSHPSLDLDNIALTVPAFPGQATRCPARRATFVDGVAQRPNDSQVDLGILDRLTVWGDVDGVPGDEVVLAITCALDGVLPFLPLVVRVAPDGTPTAIGWAGLGPDGRALVVDQFEPPTVTGGVLQVPVLSYVDAPAEQLYDKQRRGYAVRDGRVAQVDGPTEFSVGANDLMVFDPRNATLYVDVTTNTAPQLPRGIRTGYTGYVKLVAGVGTAWFGRRVDNQDQPGALTAVTVQQVVPIVVNGQVGQAALLRVEPAGGPTLQLVLAFNTPNWVYLGNRVLLARPGAGQAVRTIAADGPDRIRLDLTIDGSDATWYATSTDRGTTWTVGPV